MVLFFGTMRRNKGVQQLIDAIGLIDGDLRFHFAGRGADDVEDAVRSLTRADPRVTAELPRLEAEVAAGFALAAREFGGRVKL